MIGLLPLKRFRNGLFDLIIVALGGSDLMIVGLGGSDLIMVGLGGSDLIIVGLGASDDLMRVAKEGCGPGASALPMVMGPALNTGVTCCCC
jgi:hypothetical protein